MTRPEVSPIDMGDPPDLRESTGGKPQQLMTVDEVADYLQLEPGTVRLMAKKKLLPGKKVGRVWRFIPEELEQWIKQDVQSKNA